MFAVILERALIKTPASTKGMSAFWHFKNIGSAYSPAAFLSTSALLVFSQVKYSNSRPK